MEQHLDQEQLEQVTTLTLTKTLTKIKTITKTKIKTKKQIQNCDVMAFWYFQVQAAFALFDQDGDGRITIDELRRLYTSLGQTFSEVTCEHSRDNDGDEDSGLIKRGFILGRTKRLPDWGGQVDFWNRLQYL